MVHLAKIIPFVSTASSEAASEKLDVYQVILHHLTDHVINTGFIGYINQTYLSTKLFGMFDMRITRWLLIMWLVAFLLLLVFIPVAHISKKSLKGSKSRWVNFWEAAVEFVYKDIIEPNFGEHASKATPYFLTLFFFILFCNFLGLIPKLSTVTGNLAVTSTLALLTFVGIIGLGFIKHGPKWIITGFVPSGVPIPIAILLWLIELTGPVSKVFALAIRLFANMIAGHIAIIVFILLTIIFQHVYVGIGSVFGALFIYLLELLIAALQAYIFTVLSAVFIGSSLHEH